MPVWSKKVFCAFCICFILNLAACSSQPELPPLGPTAKILAFGDSLTFGTGATPGESYPAVLARLIGREVINAGIPGEVSADGLRRLPEILDRENPSLVLLCHGGNDIIQRLNPDQTTSNLRAMVQLCQARGIAVALLAVPGKNLQLKADPLYEQLAKELSIPSENILIPDILRQNALKADYVHPNAAGYNALAVGLADFLRKSGALP